MKARVCIVAAASAVILATVGIQAAGAEPAAGAADDSAGYFAGYFKTVDKSQAEQPHWITPLVTVTPRLEEEVRYDQVWQTRPKNADFTNYGAGKGLELIPLEPVEVILGIPGYQVLNRPGKASERGWADETFLIKYRALSSNEEHGNYIASAFLGISVPTGDPAFTADRTIFTPTLAAGKGWGSRTHGCDVQSTLSAAIPDGNKHGLGIPVVWNTAFQLHIFDEHFWPELELNYTHFSDGPNDGKNQLFYTIGAVLGRFPIAGRLRVVVGAGYEQALTAFRTFNHAWLLTLRTPF